MSIRLTIGFILFSIFVSGQPCMLYPVSLDQKIINAHYIFEGKVISSESFWGNNHSKIYTAYEIDIYKVFKGSSHY